PRTPTPHPRPSMSSLEADRSEFADPIRIDQPRLVPIAGNIHNFVGPDRVGSAARIGHEITTGRERNREISIGCSRCSIGSPRKPRAMELDEDAARGLKWLATQR